MKRKDRHISCTYILDNTRQGYNTGHRQLLNTGSSIECVLTWCQGASGPGEPQTRTPWWTQCVHSQSCPAHARPEQRSWCTHSCHSRAALPQWSEIPIWYMCHQQANLYILYNISMSTQMDTVYYVYYRLLKKISSCISTINVSTFWKLIILMDINVCCSYII